MTALRDIDLLVIGQGLAGSLLALEALDRGWRVQVVDDGHPRAASRVGAGLFTPVTGKRLALTWRAEDLLPFAASTYERLGRAHGRVWRREVPTLRLLDGEEETAKWAEPERRAALTPHVRAPREGELESFPVAPPRAAAVVEGSGWVDTAGLLHTVRNGLAASGRLIEGRFDPAEARETPEAVEWRGWRARHVALCVGHEGAAHPWLAGLPFRNARGDVLEVRIPGFPGTHIVNRGIFLLPLGGDRFRLGATFDWHRLVPEAMPDGRAELERSLRAWLRLPFEVVDHTAGVRPVCVRTRPVAGRVPGHPRVVVLTGFGAKGVLYAPFFACHVLDHLQRQAPLLPDVDPQSRWTP